MSLMYGVNVNYVIEGGKGVDPIHQKNVDITKSNVFKPTANAPPKLDLPKPPLESKCIIEDTKVEVEPKNEAPKVDIKNKDTKDTEGNCSIDSTPLGGGFGSDSETNSIDEDGVENWRGIDGDERYKIIKDLTSGERIAYFTEEELERAKRRRLRRRQESDRHQGSKFGSIFREDGKWMEKCMVHGRVSMEVEYLIDVKKELKNYVRPGGPYKLIRYAVVDEDVPVCADYADWYYDQELRYVKDYDIKGYRKRRIQRWLSEVLPIHEDERFDRYLVRCHAEALKELRLMNQEYEEYQNMFPHIVDKWVAVLHFGMLFKRKNMGKNCDINESELIIKLLREQCEMLYFKTKIIFFEESDENRDHNVVPKQHWILHPKNLCGDSPI